MESTQKSFFSKNVTFNISLATLILYGLFFLSGCSALIYQIMWQRLLFAVFGVDLESITIIVSVFMFGMGIGALCGGYIADSASQKLLRLYIIIEFGIALFGFASPSIIDVLGATFFSNSEFMTAIVSFMILAFPTILMGATFPILVTHINQSYHNIGRSTGSLYFVNTLGGAAGAFLSGFVLLYSLDINASINCAAIINIVTAFVALITFRRNA